MKYLIDSDRVVDWLKGTRETVTLLEQLSRDGLAISVISVAEVLEGIYHGREPDHDLDLFERFRTTVPTLPVETPTAETFARIRGQLRRTTGLIPDMDLLIAATAIQYGLVLVTRNVRQLRPRPGTVAARPRLRCATGRFAVASAPCSRLCL